MSRPSSSIGLYGITFSRDGDAVPTKSGIKVVTSVPASIAATANTMKITGLLSMFMVDSFGLQHGAKRMAHSVISITIIFYALCSLLYALCPAFALLMVLYKLYTNTRNPGKKRRPPAVRMVYNL